MLLEEIKVLVCSPQREHALVIFSELLVLVLLILFFFVHLSFYHLYLEADLEVKLILLPHLIQDMAHQGVLPSMPYEVLSLEYLLIL